MGQERERYWTGMGYMTLERRPCWRQADMPVIFRPCDVLKEIQSLKVGKEMVLMAFQMKVFCIFKEYLFCI
jgi:hypothetical protein